MTAFLVNGNLLTDRNVICAMRPDHFEVFGTPSEDKHFDNAFLNLVVSGVREIFDSCTNNPFGVLCEPLDYDEVACVCSNLKLGVTGLCIDCNLNSTDQTQISQFITNLGRFHKMFLLLGCLLCLPFGNTTVTSINKFIASAVAKIYKIRTEKLRELEAPWLLK